MSTCSLLLAAVMLTAACESTPTGSNENVEALEDELRFVRVLEDAPPLADTVVSFWAVRGQRRTAEIRYVTNGIYSGGVCLEFVVPADALLERPDGTRIEAGDSVRITVRVRDATRYDFDFQPSGLKFAAARPAELRVIYLWADPDFNGDGVVDDADRDAWQRFSFWRQERVDEPFLQMPTERVGAYEAVTRVTGFTRYALASN